MYGYIYKTTNTITHKIYIGQKKSPAFLSERYLGSGKHLKSSIRKYGAEHFTIELIDTAESLQELNEKERYYIALFDACNPAVGYNITKGGDGVIGVSAWNKGLTKSVAPQLHQSEETKRRRSDSLKKAYSEGRHIVVHTTKNKGKKRTAEQREANRLRNQNKVWINKDGKSTTIQKDDLPTYIENGWVRGRAQYNSTAWNKGLTKDTDSRVKAYINKRCERLLKGERLGFCKITTGKHTKIDPSKLS